MTIFLGVAVGVLLLGALLGVMGAAFLGVRHPRDASPALRRHGPPEADHGPSAAPHFRRKE